MYFGNGQQFCTICDLTMNIFIFTRHKLGRMVKNPELLFDSLSLLPALRCSWSYVYCKARQHILTNGVWSTSVIYVDPLQGGPSGPRMRTSIADASTQSC